MPMSPHRLALAGPLAAVIAILSVTIAVAAGNGTQPATPSNPIAATALQYEGTWQGQCWTFVKKVVFEATGREMGFDYRQGYLDSGALEVSITEAGPGDIVQIADDKNTDPNADYAGLHTFIITENLGKGVFNGIDSNQNYDGMVRRRDGYDPRVIAARYSYLNFHIYRFPVPGGVKPSGVLPGSAPAVTRPAPITGQRAIVSADGDGLNLRKTPGGDVIRAIPDGTIVVVTSTAPVSAGGRQWVSVSSPQGEGWVAAEYLRTSSASAQSSGKSAPLLLYRSHVAFVTSGGDE